MSSPAVGFQPNTDLRNFETRPRGDEVALVSVVEWGNSVTQKAKREERRGQIVLQEWCVQKLSPAHTYTVEC